MVLNNKVLRLSGVLNSNREFDRLSRKAKVDQICRHFNIKKNLEYDEIGLKHTQNLKILFLFLKINLTKLASLGGL